MCDLRGERDGIMSGLTRDRLGEHDEILIDAWNNVVSRSDEVWFLGDLSFGKQDQNPGLFKRLNGRKHLAIGNHDPWNVIDLGWASVQHLAYHKYGGRRFVMCHYPLIEWQNCHHGAIHLHGHCHGNGTPSTDPRMDVGVDTRDDLAPYSLDEVLEFMADKFWTPYSHH